MKTLRLFFFLSTCIFAASVAQPIQKRLYIDLKYMTTGNDHAKLKLNVKRKNDRKFEPVENLSVNLFFGEESAKGFMGAVTTDQYGQASFSIPPKFTAAIDTSQQFALLATVTGNKIYQDASVELDLERARITMDAIATDSTKSVAVTVLHWDGTDWSPVPDVDVKLYAKGSVNALPIGEEESYTTDAEGKAVMNVKGSLAANAEGMSYLAVKLEDHELYGTVESVIPVRWGSQIKTEDSFDMRTLWASRDKVPIWLLVFPNLIILSVWITIFYLLYQVVLMRKLGSAKRD